MRPGVPAIAVEDVDESTSELAWWIGGWTSWSLPSEVGEEGCRCSTTEASPSNGYGVEERTGRSVGELDGTDAVVLSLGVVSEIVKGGVSPRGIEWVGDAVLGEGVCTDSSLDGS